MRILLVDDDDGVVEALKAVLKSLPGQEVRTASGGEEALAIAAEWSGVDLLITDVVMDPMDGFTLRDHLSAQYPEMRVIQMSGYDLSDYPAQVEPFQFLAKPVDAGALRAAVARELLGAPEPQAEPAAMPEPIVAETEEETAAEPEPVAPPEPIQEPEPEAEPAVAESKLEQSEPVPAPLPVVEPEPEPTVEPTPEPEPIAPPAAVPEPSPIFDDPKPEPIAPAEPVSAPAPIVPESKSEPIAPPEPISAPDSETEKSEPALAAPAESSSDPAPITESESAPEPSETKPETAASPEPGAPVKTFAATTFPKPAPVSAPKIPPSETEAGPKPVAVVPAAVSVVRPVATASPVSVPIVKTPPPTGGPRPVAVAAPRVAGPNAPAAVKATAFPRPAGVSPVPPSSTIPAPKPVAPVASVAPVKAGVVPSTPTVKVTTTAKIQPVPQPRAVGVPSAVASPVAATAAPGAVPIAQPQAAPGTPVKATAVPTARPGVAPAKPVATAAQPKAATPPSAVAASPAAALSSVAPPPKFPTPAAPEPGEDLSGQSFGAYQILRKLGKGRWGNVYAGMQTSINRPVSLEILDADKAADAVSQSRFVADARAKAAVQHPSILAVYEAGEADGRFFYAYEFVDGESIAEMKVAGKKLDELTAIKIMRSAADGLSYLNTHHTPHIPPDPATVFLGSDGQPRLANLATQLSDEQLAPQQEIQALGRAMLGVLPAIQSLSPGLREMLKRMVQPGAQALHSWANLLQGIKTIEPKSIPTDAAKISAQDRAAIAAVEQARKQQKRALIYNLASVGSLLILVGITVWFFVLRTKQRIYDEQIQIPAGQFLFANGESKTLPDFWIDKYEVTYGQYAQFVKALENRPTTEFDHPQQPRIKNSVMHKPPHWDIFYGNARVGKAAHSTPIDLSCPIMEVDFWDAYAYAKWKGRELPTEEEWEKAARGAKGSIYPWGDEFDPSKVNSNTDFNANDPAALGKVDGFNFWSPVDAIKGDKSAFGVIGMAGNVREWTATWDQKKKRPLAKGGSFMSSDARLDQRTDLDPNAISESLGFRTVTRTPPSK